MDDLVTYSIPDLLALLLGGHGQKLQLHVGLPPTLVIFGEESEIEGPVITAEGAESMFRSLADSRQMKEFRTHGSIRFLYNFGGKQFLVQAVNEFGFVGLELQLITAAPKPFAG